MSLVLEISLPYGTRLNDEQVQYLSDVSLTPIVTRDPTAEGCMLDWNCNPLIPATALGPIEKLKPTIQRVVDNSGTRMLRDFGARTTTVLNERCSVAVAGLGLLTMNEVQAYEDLCTEKLQAALNDGWRIVAVCVQPDQRRPDYVLGRTKHMEST